MPCPIALLALLLVFVEFMISRYASDYEAFTKEWERTKSKEQREKKREKREGFYFKGNMTKRFGKLLKEQWYTGKNPYF